MQDKLIEALQEIIEVASGERQVAEDDTEGMAWIDKRARAAVRAHDTGEDVGEFFVTEYRLKEVLASYHAAESTAQLDAEESAEPVEDVVSRMCKLMGGCACEHCIKRMTAAFAVAREGYYSLEAVEKAIQKEINRYHESAAIHLYDDLVPNFLAHLKESSLAEEKLLNRRPK